MGLPLESSEALLYREQYRRLEIKVDPDGKDPSGFMAAAPEVVTDILGETDFVKNGWVDISSLVKNSPIKVQDNAIGIDSLEFSIYVGASFFIDTLFRGMEVRFKGGYLKGHSEWLFDGYIHDWKVKFPNSGKPYINIICHDRLWLLKQVVPGRITYPTLPTKNISYARTFNIIPDKKAEITVSEIVNGILADYEEVITVGSITIPVAYDWTFNIKNPISQNENESDYDFLMRLLTGKKGAGGGRKVVPGNSKESGVYAHCLFYMETGGVDDAPDTKFYIIPEDELLLNTPKDDTDLGAIGAALSGVVDVPGVTDGGDKIEFYYHIQGGEIVTPDGYNPGGKPAKLIMKDVTVSENQDMSDSQDVERIQEHPRRKKKGDGSGAADNPDADDQASSRETVEGEGGEAPESWAYYELDESKVEAAESAGAFKEFDDFALFTQVGQFQRKWNWGDSSAPGPVRRFWKRKDIVYEGSGSQIDSDGSSDSASAARGSGGKPKVRTHPERRGKWGLTLTARIPNGNPQCLAKSIYTLHGLLARYSGEWFLDKVTHNFHQRYTMSVEFKR